jgi:polar amino acid transport system ATP-binding protein/arginine:pyruvate transaminase
MRYSSRVERLYNAAASGWDVHFEAWEAQARGDDVLVLSVGDPNFDTPVAITDACVASLRAGDTHYNAIRGQSELRAAVASDFGLRTGLELAAGNVVMCAGTQNALLAASMCLLDTGDEVIGLEPMYLTYEATLTLGGADLVRVAQSADSGFRPDMKAIEAAVTDRTRALVITTPNNPSGVTLRNDELEAIAAIAITHDLWVIADEVYGDIVFEGTHNSIAGLPGMVERTVTVSSLSKSHAMTGWRVGWAVGPTDLMEHLAALQINVNYGLPAFVQAAALTALTEHRDAFIPMKETYRRRRDLCTEILKSASSLRVLTPDAGMYLMVDVSAVSGTSASFVRSLYEATGVSVLDAGAFGSSSEGWVRLSFTISDDDLAEACRRIVRFVDHYPVSVP